MTLTIRTAYIAWRKEAWNAINEGRKFSMLPTERKVSLAEVIEKLKA